MSIVFYVFFYIYMNLNLKSISKIIFNNERKYRRPLEPFSFIFLSFLPTTFWREILNIKYGTSFKKLYGKEFYYSLDKDQLVDLLKNHRAYFIFQYIIFTSTTLALIFSISAYVWDRLFK